MLKEPLLKFSDLKDYLATYYSYHSGFSNFLKSHNEIVEIQLDHHFDDLSSSLYHDTKRNPGTVDPEDVALSLKKRSFLTGYKMCSLYGWTEYIPKVIHVDWIRREIEEKQIKTIDNSALQEIAFKNKKTSSTSFTFKTERVIVLSGKYITPIEKSHFVHLSSDYNVPSYTTVPIPERLLMEALVNYPYFGGQDIVWEMGLNILPYLNFTRLVEVYDQMCLSYPYVNALGYWCEKAKISSNKLQNLKRRVSSDIKFHLFMGDKERRKWIPEWSLYVPKRFYY